MPYYAFQCENGHGSVKLLPFNKSQMVETTKTGTLRFDGSRPWVPRQEACDTCGLPATEMTLPEATAAGYLEAGAAPVRINWMAD